MTAIAPDLDDRFFRELARVAAALGTRSEALARVMMAESGCSARACNPNGNASGLIQFMPDTLRGLGWTAGDAVFRAMNATQQLPFVLQYFRPYAGQLGGATAVYVATFLPADLPHAAEPDFVLCSRDVRRTWAYACNMGFDADGDGRIRVGELTQAIARQCTGPRWAAIAARLVDGTPAPAPQPAPYDVRTTLGLQQALLAAGLDPGPVDGVPGERTRRALMAFQQRAGLVADGVPGPITRSALASALRGQAGGLGGAPGA